MRPLESLRGWFENLPPEIRKDVAAWAGTYGPEEFYPERDTHAVSGHAASFEKMLSKEPESVPMAEVGKVLAVAAIIDFIFLNRSTKKDWATVEANLEGAAEFAKSRGYSSMLDTANRWAAQVPLRAGMWIREAEKWKELRETQFSLGALDKWMHSELSESGRDLRTDED